MNRIKKQLSNLALFDKVILLVILFGIIFFAYFFFRKQEFVSATVKVGDDSIRYEPWVMETVTKTWFEQLFKSGMKETDGLGRSMAEIVNVYSYDTNPARKAVYLNLNLRAVYSRSSGQYTFKGRPLLIGSPIRLNLSGLYVEGIVTNVNGQNDPRKREKLVVEAKIASNGDFFTTTGAPDSVEKALNVGDEVKDSLGKVVIKIISKRVENANMTVPTADGRVTTARNSQRKDIYLTLQIEAIKVGDRYYVFDDIPILVGNGIPLNTPMLFVQPEVTKIEVLN